MMAPPAPGQAATEEIAWQVSGALLNPLPLTAARPCFEVLVYGTDNRLWSVLPFDPADATAVPNIQLEGSPMAMKAGEQRSFGLNLQYIFLPQVLREKKIGRVEVLAFEKR